MRLAKRILSQRGLVLGLAICMVYVLVGLTAPWLAPLTPVPGSGGILIPGYRIVGELAQRVPLPPSLQAPLGTIGSRDVFAAVVWGARDALEFGIVVALGTAMVGVLIGTLGGYLGGSINWLFMRVTDGFLTFPLIAAVILSSQIEQSLYGQYMAGYYGAPTPPPVVSALFSLQFTMILFLWMPYARLVNALVLQLKSSEFIEAARALGAGTPRILFRHLIPNSLAPVIVLISRDIGAAVLLQAALTFIHFQGNSIWGGLLANGQDWVIGLHGNPFTYWWAYIPPSLAIVLFSVGFGLVGDGLNALLNPHRQAGIYQVSERPVSVQSQI